MTSNRRAELITSFTRATETRVNVTDPSWLRTVKRAVPHTLLNATRAATTAALSPVARRRVDGILASPPVLLNLGSGFAPVEGWTNVDRAGTPVDLPWNLARGIPFPDVSVDGVACEHLYEHLSLNAAYQLSHEVLRVLRPGGIFRISVPDAGLCLRSYAGTDDADWAESQPTRMQAVMSLFYAHDHRTMYDEELLTCLADASGFIDVTVRQYGQSAFGLHVPDSANRREGTLYVESRKFGDGPQPL